MCVAVVAVVSTIAAAVSCNPYAVVEVASSSKNHGMIRVQLLTTLIRTP
jgi:hypothetical protein